MPMSTSVLSLKESTDHHDDANVVNGHLYTKLLQNVDKLMYKSDARQSYFSSL